MMINKKAKNDYVAGAEDGSHCVQHHVLVPGKSDDLEHEEHDPEDGPNYKARPENFLVHAVHVCATGFEHPGN